MTFAINTILIRIYYLFYGKAAVTFAGCAMLFLTLASHAQRSELSRSVPSPIWSLIHGGIPPIYGTTSGIIPSKSMSETLRPPLFQICRSEKLFFALTA